MPWSQYFIAANIIIITGRVVWVACVRALFKRGVIALGLHWLQSYYILIMESNLLGQKALTVAEETVQGIPVSCNDF
jgi:hypothetical protein